MEKKYLVWEPILRRFLYLRGKICVQSNTLARYENVKTSIATSKSQSQYLKHNHKWTIWQILLTLILRIHIQWSYIIKNQPPQVLYKNIKYTTFERFMSRYFQVELKKTGITLRPCFSLFSISRERRPNTHCKM